MNRQTAAYFGRVLLAPLALCCANAVAAGSPVSLPATVLTQPAGLSSLAAVPAPAAALPALPAGLSENAGASGAKNQAALPGFEGVSNAQGEQSAMRAAPATNGIRPIRLPPSILPVPLPLPIPLLSGS